MIIANEAQGPAAFDNLVDKPEAESAALLAGSILLSAAGWWGSAFLVVPQTDRSTLHGERTLTRAERGLPWRGPLAASECCTLPRSSSTIPAS